MKDTFVFSYLVSIVFFLFCLTTVMSDDQQRVFCDPKRRVWYNADGKASVPMGQDKLHAKVVEGPLQKDEKNTLTICLFENKVVFEEFIRLINMELPQTLEGKCYLGCVLYHNNIVDEHFKPRYYVHSALATTLGPFLVGIMQTVGSSFIFSGDKKIYKDIDLSAYLNLAKKIGIDCLREMEKKAKADKDAKSKDAKATKGAKKQVEGEEAKKARLAAEHVENCNRMYEYLQCAVHHENFNSLRKTSLDIVKLKLTNKKRVIEDPKSSKGGQASSSTKSTTKLPATYAEYCQDKP